MNPSSPQAQVYKNFHYILVLVRASLASLASTKSNSVLSMCILNQVLQ
uniref:Uncharacterized protein n=1 Tax=Medicago truncatula TaxID=3880 RepID=I3S8K9_MEDTR|nr:unknown [Medicago truncatula]